MSKAFDSAKYRLQNQKYGQPVRWWKAFPCECVDPMTGVSAGDCELCERDGRRYVEQSLPNGIDGKPLRVYVYESKQEIQTSDFGPLPSGSAVMSIFPDVMPVARLDRVTIAGRVQAYREVLTRGASDRDALNFGPVERVLSMVQDTVALTGWELEGDRLVWTEDAPAEGSRYTVEYEAQLLYFCVVRLKTQGLGSDGVPLQDEWALSLKPLEKTHGD